MLPIWVVFWAQISLNKGPFVSRFSLNMNGSSEKLAEIAKNWWFSVKIHHKVGMTASVGN